MRFRPHTMVLLLGGALAATQFAAAPPGQRAAVAPRTLDEYRDFRALSIDLVGRIPTRAELDAFEQPAFRRDAWIEAHLGTTGYAQRLTRVYMDLLRLEIGNAVAVSPQATTLRRTQILGPDGKPLYVYYRRGERRSREATDGEFCLTAEETGLELVNNQPPRGTAMAVKASALDEATVLVKPWWLYRDYLQVSPTERYGTVWTNADAMYQPSDRLLKGPDGTPVVEVRVCREEAQVSDHGTIYASGRPVPAKGAPLPKGRTRPAPVDDAYAKQHKGEALSCRSAVATTSAIDCGCGVGLQYCLPGDADADQPSAFMLPSHSPLGPDEPMPSAVQTNSSWTKYWWSAEVVQFMGKIFGEDRDFRDVLLAKYTWLNGPLAQYYRSTAPASCCGRERAFGMVDDADPLLDVASVPESLKPHDTSSWIAIADRGPHASGILTMPVFLEKFASRRARAAVLYNAFTCKSFVSSSAELTPSTEPNLMLRPGCSSCHATLEPLAAYFARVEESTAVYLPPKFFPLDNAACKLGKNGKAAGFCDAFYDPSFSDPSSAKLRGAYASPDHADAGPRGIAEALTRSPEFASCAVQRVGASILGRTLSPDDDALVRDWSKTFVDGGYRMRALVHAILSSDAYRRTNDIRASNPPAPSGKLAPDDAFHGGSP